MRRVWMIALICLLPLAAMANDRLVRVYAPAALVETGLMKHALPRFSLKTQVRVELVATAGEADLVLGEAGRALFRGLGQQWHMTLARQGHPGTDRLAGWLESDVGQRTILGFAPDGEPLFSPPSEAVVEVAAVEPEGDAGLGHAVSRIQCGRCHAVDQAGRKNDIGSTPSFFVLRSFADWQDRFAAFYVLKPHGAFTQIAEVTEPFPDERPPPIVPVTLTLDELEAVLAYVAGLEAADLGAPLQHQ